MGTARPEALSPRDATPQRSRATRRRSTGAVSSLLVATALAGCAHDANQRLPSDALASQMRQSLEPNDLDRALLEQAVVFFTNRARQKRKLATCAVDERLQVAARDHSETMALAGDLFHASPKPGPRLPQARTRNEGIGLTAGQVIHGENIAVDYFLDIADVPHYRDTLDGGKRYFDAETDEPIEYQTYWEFARKAVAHWLRSPGHRENLLRREFTHVGIGVVPGSFRGLAAVYVTQRFYGTR
jgi:uncharacterized protein YkwD